MLDRIKHNFPDLNPTESVPEEFYNKLMNIVEIFVGKDQMLQRLGKIDKKRITLISHNGSGFHNWIVLKNAKKLSQCPLVTAREILSLPLPNSFTDEYLQKKWNSNYLQNINFICSYQHEKSSLAAWGNSSNLPMNLRKITDINIAKYTEDNWESLRHEWEPYAKRDTLCLGACLIKYNKVMKEVVFQNISNNLTAPSLSLKEYSKSKKDKTEVNSELKKIKCTHLMAFDANGLYASAMSDLDSESGRPFLPEENKESVKLFNKQKFRRRTAILKVWFEYPTNMFFQPIPAKDKITFTNKEEIVKADGRIIRILDGIVYEENFKTPPYRDYILILRDLRNKYKREEINDEEKEFDCTPPKSTRLTPSHLGSFVLSHSKKIMNNFIRVIDGFYKPEIYFTDTDSLYISFSNWDKLNEAGLVSENDYCKGKNDYGDGGIIFGLYLEPNVKYNIILASDGILKEKKTFKGYSNDKIAVEDYIRLASEHDVTNEFTKPWGKSFTNE
ncbi:hypothetical protein LOTGIDRAFT_171433 [Lottia gigantea]|uniref:DNA-directed DNA polymerase n=1 Tax=Lottia gigantea TaxID=225164 RepID=V4CMD8_LOTGI|nr:hypothetical protein LOTGIDRAFT_171433 [Lottia gigantea]ESP03495.1 hypothetical protein LOTGIDRAFT_171433 [Lottia gigantea]